MNKAFYVVVCLVVVVVTIFAIVGLSKSYNKGENAPQESSEKLENEKENKPKSKGEKIHSIPKQEEIKSSLDDDEDKLSYIPRKAPPKPRAQDDEPSYFDEDSHFSEIGNGGKDSFTITTQSGKINGADNEQAKEPSQSSPEAPPLPSSQNSKNPSSKDSSKKPLEFSDMSEEEFLEGLDDMASNDFFDLEFGSFD